jgi:Flp pilus assembly protein, secretin CpaC
MLTTNDREMKMGKHHNGLTALFAALALVGSCGLFSASVQAASPSVLAAGADFVSPEQGSMEISIGREGLAPIKATAGKSFIMRTGNIALKRVSVSDPGVVDYTLLSPSELYMLPKRYGSTNITLWTRDNKTAVIDLNVEIDTDELQNKLAELLPDEKNIKVTSAAKSIVLTGMVSSPMAVSQAVDIAEAYVRFLNRDIVLPVVAGGGEVGPGTRVSIGSTNVRQAAATAGVAVINLLKVTDPMQVLLEVKVAEVSKGLLNKLGAQLDPGATITGGDWSASLLTALAAGVDNTLSITGPNGTKLTIDAEDKDTIFRILAEPNIMAISGQEGNFLAGGRIFIPVSRVSDTGGTTVTFEEKEFGVRLRFVPTVLAHGRINLKVEPEVSEVNSTGTPFSSENDVTTAILPSLNVRKASTTVQLNDGQSFAIAGLIKSNVAETIRRIPLLGEIPILGALFSSKEFKDDQTELMFVVTPRLVKPLPPNYKLPTDNFKAPNRAEFMLEGRMESATPPAAPAPAPAKASPDNLRMN